MSDDYSPDESPEYEIPGLPEGLSQEDAERLLAEDERPEGLPKKAVEETLERLEMRFKEIVADLEPHGIAMFNTAWDCNPAQWNLSRCDPESARLAQLMFELGCIVADYSHLDARLQFLEPRVAMTGVMTVRRVAQGGETALRIRTALAELLQNDEDAIGLSDKKIAERLNKTLKELDPSETGNSVPTICRELRKFRKEIKAMATELEIRPPVNVSQVRRVAEHGEGKPGVSFSTVQFFLI